MGELKCDGKICRLYLHDYILYYCPFVDTISNFLDFFFYSSSVFSLFTIINHMQILREYVTAENMEVRIFMLIFNLHNLHNKNSYLLMKHEIMLFVLFSYY